MATRLPVSSLWVRTDEPLLWLGGAGLEHRTDSSYYFDCRSRPDRPHYVLQLTLGGACFYERLRTRTLLTAGMAFLDRIPGEFSYGYPAELTIPYDLVYVGFAGRSSESLCHRITAEFGHILNFGRDSAVQTMMLAIAHQHAAQTLRDRYVISGMLYQLLMTILTHLKSSQLETTPLLHGALALIDAHASDHRLNIKSLAEQLGCSREHLTRQFHEGIGVSAGDYLTQHRLGAASTFLRQTDDKLEVIALKSGFASANYLCRAFRKRYGITPAQFRRTPWLVTE